MMEGWNGDDYLILFDESEREAAESRYALTALLPGFKLLGLRGWDDFIVEDSERRMYSVPTVPVHTQYLAPYRVPRVNVSLRPDSRFVGKIKWYLKPIAFGGDPELGPNLVWVDHEEHRQLVRFWNDQYRALRQNKE